MLNTELLTFRKYKLVCIFQNLAQENISHTGHKSIHYERKILINVFL